MDIIKQAKEEAAALERSIAISQAKLDSMRLWIAQGEKLFGGSSLPPSATLARNLNGPVVRRGAAPIAAASKPRNKKDRVMAVVASALANGARMQTKSLVELVQAAGLELTGDPVQTLSVYVSRDGRFESARALGGWGLKTNPNKEKAPQGVDAPAGPTLLDFSVPDKDTGTVAG
jgi:hypothetical protein